MKVDEWDRTRLVEQVKQRSNIFIEDLDFCKLIYFRRLQMIRLGEIVLAAKKIASGRTAVIRSFCNIFL